MPQVSVIVPARDVEDYIGAVLEDLRRQSFGDLEVIVVDDGSTDATGRIVSGYAQRDGRFREVSSGGVGVSGARNLGVAHATGEFFAFVDSDDRVSPDYLATMHRSASATGSDLVVCNADRLDGFRTSPSMLQRRACARPRTRTHISHSPQLVWDTTVWNKLWRRTMWDRAGIRYAEGRWINDVVPAIHGHVAARQVDVLGDVLYYWRVRTDPASSITDSKLSDPVARSKSFHDRIHAVRRARELLAAAVPGSAALPAFDQRILELDLPIYLPYYHGADEPYREDLVGRIRQLLETFAIEPSRFPLGMLLQEVYAAVRSDDRARLSAALDAGAGVVPSPTHRQHTELRLPAPAPGAAQPAPAGPPPARSGRTSRRTPHGLLRWGVGRLVRQAGRRGTVPPRLNAAAAVHEVEVDPAGHLTVRGAVRAWEGRSYLFAGWHVAARLDTTPRLVRALTARVPGELGRLLRDRLSGWTRVTGAPAPAGDPPDAALHPLVRSGWLPFTARIDLGATRRHRRVARWRFAVELRGGRVRLRADTALAGEVAACLPLGVTVEPDSDLVPTVGPAGELSFRRVPAAVRLSDATASRSTLVLQFEFAPSAHAKQAPRVWLRRGDSHGHGHGHGHVQPVPATPETHLPLPPDLASHPGVYELWYQSAGAAARVRAGSHLPPTAAFPVAGHEHHLAVTVGPDAHGNAVITVAPPHLDLHWAAPGEDPGSLDVGGAGDPPPGGTIELHCRWTDARALAPLRPGAHGWRATIDTGALDDTTPGQGRVWTLTVVDQHGRRPLQVPPSIRGRFPLATRIGDITALLELQPDGLPRLSTDPPGPGADLWPQLARVQRSGTGPPSGPGG